MVTVRLLLSNHALVGGVCEEVNYRMITLMMCLRVKQEVAVRQEMIADTLGMMTPLPELHSSSKRVVFCVGVGAIQREYLDS